MATKKKATKKTASKKAPAKKGISTKSKSGKKNGKIIQTDDNGGGIQSPKPSARPPRRKS